MAALDINNLVLIIILTIVHIVAIFFAWRVGSVFGSKSWIFVLSAFSVLLIKRLIDFLALFEIISYGGFVELLDRIYIPIIFWVLIGLGMFKLYSKVHSSMDLERKIKRIDSKKRKK